MRVKSYKQLLVLITLLIIIVFVSLSYGATKIGIFDSAKAIFSKGLNKNVIIIQKIRLPRTLGAIITGATLGLSGLFTRIALKNPLADSSILGIQSGASVMALVALLIFPTMSGSLPLFAFLGGLIAFFIVTILSYSSTFKALNIILSGVAVNSLFSALISIITVINVHNLKKSISWSSGSLVGITNNEVQIMLIYTALVGLLIVVVKPVLELLRLDDNMLISLGKSPAIYRIIISVVAVFLASISLSFVGVIAFVGIIAPHIAKLLEKNDLRQQILLTTVIGAIIVLGADVLGRLLFISEIPVGSLVGVIGAPLFIYLLRSKRNDV